MDEDGNISKPYFCQGSMNKEIYIKECIKKRLLPFIRQHHEIDKILFWPDLATCHYAKVVIDFLQRQNMSFVPKRKILLMSPKQEELKSFGHYANNNTPSDQKSPKICKDSS
jgi:hypothetical protein